MDNTKWEPDSEKYNQTQYQQSGQSPQKKPKKSKTWIPITIIAVVLVAALVVGAIVGVNTIKKLAKEKLAEKSSSSESVPQLIIENDEDADSISEQEENVGSTQNVASANASGVMLTDVSDIVEEVMPSVVSVTSRSLVSNGDFFGFYSRRSQGQGSTQEVESGLGSGTIVGQNESEILILTSYHVVDGASSFYLTFCDETSVEAYLKDSDEVSDIAVVAAKIDDISDETLDVIRIATLNPDDISVGDGVIVIGNALGYGQSVVTGIVSAKDRTFTSDEKSMTVIQTDASINSGNSGGCMLDQNGEIIGISEAKISSTSVEGVCYAISIHQYYDEIMEMLEVPAVTEDDEDDEASSGSGSGYIGIYGRDIDSELASAYGLSEGVYVLSTIQGGGAEAAGIKNGDIIIGLNGKSMTTMTELQSELKKYDAGDVVTLTIMRYSGTEYVETDIEVTLTSAIG